MVRRMVTAEMGKWMINIKMVRRRRRIALEIGRGMVNEKTQIGLIQR